MKGKKLYLFDFDGTLTNVDTLFDFLKFSFPEKYNQLYFKFIPLFILAKLHLVNVEATKKKFIVAFLKGKSKSEISALSKSYFDKNSTKILRPSAVEFIQSIVDSEDVYIVSASLDIWLQPFADFLNARLICTKAAYDAPEIFSGNFLTPNCNYDEKIIRIKQEIDLNKFDEIFVFGDSKGDKAMSTLATRFHYRHFNL